MRDHDAQDYYSHRAGYTDEGGEEYARKPKLEITVRDYPGGYQNWKKNYEANYHNLGFKGYWNGWKWVKTEGENV